MSSYNVLVQVVATDRPRVTAAPLIFFLGVFRGRSRPSKRPSMQSGISPKDLVQFVHLSRDGTFIICVWKGANVPFRSYRIHTSAVAFSEALQYNTPKIRPTSNVQLRYALKHTETYSDCKEGTLWHGPTIISHSRVSPSCLMYLSDRLEKDAYHCPFLLPPKCNLLDALQNVFEPLDNSLRRRRIA